MAAKDSKDTRKIAAELDLFHIDTQDAIQRISQDILLSMYKKKTTTSEMRDKIRKVYEEWNPGATWRDDTDKVSSIMLLGPPGQGKTTAFRQAAIKVSNALGLRFVERQPREYKVKGDEFLFLTHQFSAENSKVDMAGIPAKMEEDGVAYMTRLVSKPLVMLTQAPGGLLLLDDFPNASPNIQNIGLDITEEKRFNDLDLEGVYIGLTGNLGPIDGTNTSRMSTALRGRCQTYFTEDTRVNFINRLQSRYKDELGDVGVAGFLSRFEQHFAVMPNARQSGGFPSPRSWDKFIAEARREVQRAGGRGTNAVKALPKLMALASSYLGLEVGQELHSYMRSMMISADPLARALIMEGKLSKDEVAKRFKDGFSAEQQHFAYQYATALVDYCVQKIVVDQDMKEAIKRFAVGVVPLSMDVFNLSIDNLKAKLANQMEEYSMPAPAAQSSSGRMLTTETKKEIAKIVSMTPEFSAEHHKNLLDALTDSTKFDSAARPRARRK